MNSKKILAMIVAVAMVVAIVPAFTLTAGAADASVIETLGAKTLWSAPSGDYFDYPIASAFPGWSVTPADKVNMNVRTYDGRTAIQVYGDGGGKVSTLTTPGFGANAEKIVVEWVHKNSGNSSVNYVFKDIEGNVISNAWIDESHATVEDQNPFGNPAEDTVLSVVAYNEGENHTTEFYVNGELSRKRTDGTGKINGFKSIEITRYSTGTWRFENLTVAAVYPDTYTVVTAQYTVNDNVVATEVGAYETATGSGFTFPAKDYAPDGDTAIYHTDGEILGSDGTITMTAIENDSPEEKTVTARNGRTYAIEGNNLIPNGDFSKGMLGWFDGRMNTPVEIMDNGDGTVKLNAHQGLTNNETRGGVFYRSFPIEANETYIFTSYVDVNNAYHRVSLCNELGINSETELKAIFGIGDYDHLAYENAPIGQSYYAFTNTEGYKYLKVLFRWSQNNSIGKFGLYKARAVDAPLGTVSNIEDGLKIVAGSCPVIGNVATVEGGVFQTESSLDAGEHSSFTIKDRLTGDEYIVNKKVTVLPMAFESTKSTKNTTVKFPEERVLESGGFTIEFDFRAESLNDLHIYIGKDGAEWGAGGILIGFSKNDTEADLMLGQRGSHGTANAGVKLNANTDYRMLVMGSLDDYTYGVIIRDSSGAEIYNDITAVTDDHWFRTNQGLNSIRVTDRGNGVYVRNVKVHTPEAPSNLKASLGWDEENSKFTANFTVDEGTASSFKITPQNGEPVAAVSNDGVIVDSEKTNRYYSVMAVNNGARSTTVKASVYGLVMEAIGNYAKADEVVKINSKQLDKVNEVLKNGGLYLKKDSSEGNANGYKLADGVANVLALSTAGTGLKVEITEAAVKAGLSFGDTGAEITTIEGATAIVAEDGKSVMITLPADMEALEDIFLEEIEFVFEPDEVVESADEVGSVDFVEEI